MKYKMMMLQWSFFVPPVEKVKESLKDDADE
jgi:hypothetical protein